MTKAERKSCVFTTLAGYIDVTVIYTVGFKDENNTTSNQVKPCGTYF